MGLAIAAVVKGYKCIFTTTDKQSKEKIDALRAFGAEVIVCPTNVDPEDPRSVLLGVVAARARDSELLESQPVRQPLEHQGALRTNGPRDLGADRRPRDAPGMRCGDGRDDQRCRPIPEGAQLPHQGVGHRYLRVGVQEVQGDWHLRQERDLSVRHRRHRRGFPARKRRFRHDRSLREGDGQGRRHHDASDRARGGHLRGKLSRVGDGGAASIARQLHQ